MKNGGNIMKKIILVVVVFSALLIGCAVPVNLIDMTSYSAEGTEPSNVIEWEGVQ